MKNLELKSFVDFVRSSGTPVLGADDPADQSALRIMMYLCSHAADSKPMRERAILRMAALAATSGRVETLGALMKLCHWDVGDAALVDALSEFCQTELPFWRGGQPHGSLQRNAVATVFKSFCMKHLENLLLSSLAVAAAKTDLQRHAELKKFMDLVPHAAKVFGGSAYWQKRYLELLCVSGSDAISVEALEHVFDVYPLGKGTREGLLMIFPAATTSRLLREAVRVLQRSLGGGRRLVHAVPLCALLCFWKRALGGTITWQVGRK